MSMPLQSSKSLELTKVSPLVNEASEASRFLCKGDIIEIKSLAKPPQPVMMVCVCVCILLGRDEDAGWAGAKAMLSDPALLKTLMELEKEDMTNEQIEKVRELLNKDEDIVQGMKSVSKAAYGLLQWVLAMIDY